MASQVLPISQIANFYNGKKVLITGGTGFMGTILIEKLLRSTDVATIYLLIREKKGKNVHSRLDELFDNIIFDRLKTEKPKFRHRVVALSGDCSISGLGLTIDDRQTLLSNVNLVFHVAATLRFNENLKVAYSINVRGTQDVLELCQRIEQFKGLVYVSTAYSNCYESIIKEKIYNVPVDYETIGQLIEKLSNQEADALTPKIIGKWPNTYTFTKALTESMLHHTTNLPIAIFRPTIVISTYKEPIAGWTCSYNGANGACAAIASGLLRTLHVDPTKLADVIPVDCAISALLATGWDLQTSSKLQIYNYVSSTTNPITWGQFNALNNTYNKLNPARTSIWPFTTLLIRNRNLYLLVRFLFHTLPAFLFDCALAMIGRKMFLSRMYAKMHRFNAVIGFFSVNEWRFESGGVERMWQKMNGLDRQLFPFCMEQVSWLQFARSYTQGLRRYLLKEAIGSAGEEGKRMERVKVVQRIVKCLILGVGARFGVVFVQSCASFLIFLLKLTVYGF